MAWRAANTAKAVVCCHASMFATFRSLNPLLPLSLTLRSSSIPPQPATCQMGEEMAASKQTGRQASKDMRCSLTSASSSARSFINRAILTPVTRLQALDSTLVTDAYPRLPIAATRPS